MGAMLSTLVKMMYAKKEMRVFLVGLNAAGKTTILYRLKRGEVVTANEPTVVFNVETLEYNDVSLNVCEVGGQFKFMEMWRHYVHDTVGLIFVVDSNNRERIEEARDVLQNMLKEDKVGDVTLLVYANKQDLPNAMPVAEVTDILDLTSLHHRRWHIQAACATSGEGLYEGLDWFSSNVYSKAT